MVQRRQRWKHVRSSGIFAANTDGKNAVQRQQPFRARTGPTGEREKWDAATQERVKCMCFFYISHFSHFFALT